MPYKKIIRINLSDLLLLLYLCIPFINMIIAKVIPLNGMINYAPYFTIIVLAIGYWLVCAKNRKFLVPEFWVFYFTISIFFLLTIFIYPEYKYWYERNDFGVWNYVLRPDNGLFIYLFIRLVDNPKRIKNTIKYSGWIMYIYYALKILNFLKRGYWIDISNRGYEIHMTYNLSLGYDVLIFALTFLYCALEDKKKRDWMGTIIGIGIILIAGSRGPFLDIAIFFIFYIFIKIVDNRKRIKYIIGTISTLLVTEITYPYLITTLSNILTQFNIKSRFLTSMLNGNITDDNRRYEIWNAAIEMIRERPLGYGAMGSRHVMSNYIYVAHPHQIFLELLVDFGVVFGGIIILLILYNTIKLFFMKEQNEWKGVFLIFFSRACQLLISLTFWHSIGLWGAIAVGVCMYNAKGKGGGNVS